MLIIRFQKQNVEFVHKYNFTNYGPSPINKNKTIGVYVPVSKFLNKTAVTVIIMLNAVNKSECKINEQKLYRKTPKVDRENVIACSNTKCIMYNCTVPSNWKKGESKIIKIHLQFLPKYMDSDQSKIEKKKSLAIFTHARIADGKIFEITRYLHKM